MEALSEVVTCKRKSQDGESVGRKRAPARRKTKFTGCEVEKRDQCGRSRGKREKKRERQRPEQDNEGFDRAGLAAM